jgi:predicted nucleic acid-binding Zn ribbon protein
VPTYEYRCENNGSLVEVQHKMAERLSTWGELCARAGISRGRTDAKAPVHKLMSASFIGTGAAQSSMCEAPACGMGACESGPCESGPCDGGVCAAD